MESIRAVFAPGSVAAAGISRAYVEQLPYASIVVNVGRSQSLLVLIRDDGALHWATSEGQILTTVNSRLVKTAGLSDNIVGISAANRDPVYADLHRVPADTTYRRLIDLSPDHRFNLGAVSTFRRRGTEQVEILEKTFNLLKVEEYLRVPGLGFSATNIFWVEPDTGFVRKSRQFIGPGTPAIEIEIAKPYSGAAS